MTTATIASGTLTSSTPGIDASQTWNASGVTFTGWKFAITNTASASASRIVDYQVGGSTYMSLGLSNPATNSGPTWYGNGAAPYIQLSQSNGTTVGYSTNTQMLWGTSRIEASISGTATWAVLASHSRVSSGVTRSWSSDSTPTGTPDLSLSRSAANVLQIAGASSAPTALFSRRFTVTNLPAASSYDGALAFVSDASATTARSTVSGGGANKVMVQSDGTNWIIVG